MVFNSITFVIFFIIFYHLYWWINNRFSINIRNFLILVSSYIFYGWWDWRFLGLIFVSSLADFFIGLKMDQSSNRKIRRILLLASIGVNLGILGFFKYFNFFIDSFNELLSGFALSVNTSTLNIILPVGISFYTFQTLSYTIDIYKGKLKHTKDILSFFVFVAFFPQLVAGPIERASRLLHQFQKKQIFNYHSNVSGLRLILWGLFKKIVIADNFGLFVDQIFDPSNPISGLSTLIGAILFAFQVYADFSGYSDIAIGVSKMLGINLMKNFSTPYFSASFTEFWKRWHISLSTWFKDYLYIPLGGSRRKEYRVYLNLFITFLLSGLWHGAQITFVIWGALHGLVLIIERKFKLTENKRFAIPLFFMSFVILLIPFRAENVSHLLILSKSLLNFSFYTTGFLGELIVGFSTIKFLILSVIFIIFMVFEWKMGLLDFSEWISGKSIKWKYSIYYFLLLCIIMLGNFDVKPYFIYFQF